ncbi:unnamed protein product [Amoebophrya sp. A120]|nr:unnamed protein product [Amoebophrya sp. A120]|eukprot:GSA120T00023140001.1
MTFVSAAGRHQPKTMLVFSFLVQNFYSSPPIIFIDAASVLPAKITTKEEMEKLCLRHPRFIEDYEKEINSTTVNHYPFKNTKKVLVKYGEIPGITQIAVAEIVDDFPPHSHEDMFELFYMLPYKPNHKDSGPGTLVNGNRDGQNNYVNLFNFGIGDLSKGEKAENYTYWPENVTNDNEFDLVPDYKDQGGNSTAGTMLLFPPGIEHSGGIVQDSGPLQLITIGAIPFPGETVEQYKVAPENSQAKTLKFGKTQLDELKPKPMKDNEKITKRVMLPLPEKQYPKLPHFITFAESTLPKNQRNPKHIHADAYEVYFVMRGQGYMELDGEEKPIKTGSVVIVPPKIEHGPIAHKNSELQLLYFMIETPKGPCQHGISSRDKGMNQHREL